MDIGINYPWYNYAWDFGTPPRGWTPRAPWTAHIANDLAAFKRCGVKVVRWFILADGMTYGYDGYAPRRSSNQWRFDRIPAIDQTVLDDFRQLLQVFSRRGMKLLPVLIDFHWAFPGLDRTTQDCPTLEAWYGSAARPMSEAQLQEARKKARSHPQGYVKGGRSDLIHDPTKSSQFFRRVLEPLLAVSRRHRETIYAWELINEPEWITSPKSLHDGNLPDAQRIPLSRMLRFIREGMTTIQRYGFRATVGFAKALTIPNWERSMPSGRSLGMDLNQIHYYPRVKTDVLTPANFPNQLRGVLGEFASRTGISACDRNKIDWPELSNGTDNVTERLILARSKRYAAAFPWSYRAVDCATQPNRSTIETALSGYT